MATSGVPESDVLDEAKKVSFANASSLQKANRVLEKTLELIGEPNLNGKHEVLSSDGILRTAGAGSLTSEALPEVLADPTQKTETVYATLKEKDINSWMDVLKRSFSKAVPPITFSEKAQELMQKFIANAANDFDFMKLIDGLIAAKAYEEAKALYNYVYLGYLIAKQHEIDIQNGLQDKDTSKMGPQATGLLLAAQISPLIWPTLDLTAITDQQKLSERLNKTLGEELKQTNPQFNASFDKKYPNVAKELAQQYVKLPTQAPVAASIEPVKEVAKKSSGATPVTLLKAIIGTVKSILGKFSLFGKKKKAKSEVTVSAPLPTSASRQSSSSESTVSAAKSSSAPLPDLPHENMLDNSAHRERARPTGRRAPSRNRTANQKESSSVIPEAASSVVLSDTSTPKEAASSVARSDTPPPKPPRKIPPPVPPRGIVAQRKEELVKKVEDQQDKRPRPPIPPRTGQVAEGVDEFEKKMKSDLQPPVAGRRPEAVTVILESEKPKEGMVDELKAKFEKESKGKPPIGGKPPMGGK